MKKIMLVIGVVGGIFFCFFSFNKDKDSLKATPAISEQSLPASSAAFTAEKLTHVNEQTVEVAPEKQQSKAQPQAEIAEFQLLPEEVSVMYEWGDGRGYDIDGRFTLGYESMGQETLIALANQHDPKAHLVLANRILANIDWHKYSRAEVDQLEHHFYQASVLGYTSTLSELSNLMQRKSIREFKSRQDLILEAYKFAYVGELRGDPNSSTQLEVLRLTNPLSESDTKSILIKADSTYKELSLQRQRLGLPEFDNTNPPEVHEVVKRVRAFAELMTQKLKSKE